MSWVNLGVAAIGVVGASMGSKGSTSESSSRQELDPRMQRLVYEGGGSGGGLTGDMMQNYQTQRAQGGLNPMQRSGMEMQRQTLMDPGFTEGYNQMRNVGMGLLGSPVAGNPFTTGSQTGNPFRAGNVQAPPAQGQQFQQNSQMQAAYQPMAAPAPFVAPQQQQGAQQLSPLEEYLEMIRRGEYYRGAGGDGPGDGGVGAGSGSNGGDAPGMSA